MVLGHGGEGRCARVPVPLHLKEVAPDPGLSQPPSTSSPPSPQPGTVRAAVPVEAGGVTAPQGQSRGQEIVSK